MWSRTDLEVPGLNVRRKTLSAETVVPWHRPQFASARYWVDDCISGPVRLSDGDCRKRTREAIAFMTQGSALLAQAETCRPRISFSHSAGVPAAPRRNAATGGPGCRPVGLPARTVIAPYEGCAPRRAECGIARRPAWGPVDLYVGHPVNVQFATRLAHFVSGWVSAHGRPGNSSSLFDSGPRARHRRLPTVPRELRRSIFNPRIRPGRSAAQEW